MKKEEKEEKMEMEKMEKELFNDKMWHNWRSLYIYIDCLKDEEAITDRTWTSMNDYLMELKSLLPSERDD